MKDLDRSTLTLNTASDNEVESLRPQRLLLEVHEMSASPRPVELPGPKAIIGAHPQADLRINSDSASSIHCELEVTDVGVVLRDLESKNGTRLNDNIRVQEVTLTPGPGAEFSVGSTRIKLLRVDEEPVPISTSNKFGDMLGRGPKMGRLFASLSPIAKAKVDVLVLGESGTGKEVLARAIHDASPRRDSPFVILDCTSISHGLAESILFGHMRGSFTGAIADSPGVFEAAHGGTLFMDELGELPLPQQAKLLRALQSRSTQRIGDSQPRAFDVRIIAATNVDLRRQVNEGRFREDLFFRMAAVECTLPPLRERHSSNIVMLAEHFLAQHSSSQAKPKRALSNDARASLKAHHWPGNVRELQLTVTTAAAIAEGDTIHASDLRFFGSTRHQDIHRKPFVEAREDFERRYLTNLLEISGGNKAEAARRSGLSRNGLLAVLKRLGIT